MNILELDSYNLADTVKFHNRLNPRLWDSSEHLLPEVKAKLMQVAQDFQEFLGVPDLGVKDITISGSNAAFNYTPTSDIDLHLVIDVPNVTHDEVYRELFNAKKYQYNDEHDIRIRGADVELYAQDSAQPHHSQGIYSLLNDAWVSVPKRTRAEIDDVSTRSKFEDLAARIDDVIKSQDVGRMDSLMKKIKTMRQTGLEKQGEFGSDNLAFKLLRNNEYIKRLIDAKQAARDHELSLAELAQHKQKVRYGFGESPDGVDPTTKMFLEEPATESPDGVNPTTAMFLTEVNTESVVQEFIQHTADRLGIQHLPKIIIHHDQDWSESNHSFGMYVPDRHELHVSLGDRHLLDILRTTAHELCHCAQHESEPLPDHAGDTGSAWENEANAVAGIVMRDFANSHPEYFQHDAIKESASGYIPTKAQAKDPRYSMALTVDIKPGQVGKEANKLNLKTDRQGKPALLMKTVNLQESLAAEFATFAEGKSYGYNSTPLSQVPGETEDDLGNQEATGPEFPPQMPAGTTKIDVSDLTDWYRLGMDISDLDDAKPEDYNQGPPQTVVVFPSDEAEQGYLKQFKRLGLKTHDMDPDVKGGEDTTGKHLNQKLAEEFALFEQQDLFEINMGSKNLRKEAAKTGAIAGMEFEMIVPNVEGGDDDGNMEADYSLDEGITSIQEAYDFFYDGDYNSRGDVTRLRDKMTNEYYEWLSDQFDARWDSDEFEFVYHYLVENASGDEIAEILGTEPNEAGEYPDPNKQSRVDATDKVVEEGYGNYWYDQARESAQEDFNQNADLESEWLESRDLNTMQDIEGEYDISWPHWEQQGGGEASIQDVAQEFENAIDRPVQASGNYHSGSVRRPSPTAQHYVVEPDGSLEADDSDDVGLEFVSPPLPIDEILSDLNKVKQWAKVYGCYTNDSTGLHINISVPNYSRENLDFVKLALLMGDEYVLDNFGRAGNTYAKSAMKLVRDQVRQKPDEAERLLDKMKGNLDSLASKAIHSGATSKYTSINTKDGHIEFRSPGGDWLDENFDKIENTLLRFTVAMSAALNPEMYREEYLKKLYKLLTQDQKGDDTIKYFSEYVAGKIPAAALRSFVKQARLERKLKKGDTDGKKYWWDVSWGNGRVEVVATTKEEAIETAFKESYWAPDEPDTPQAKQFKGSLRAKPLSPYNEPPIKEPTGDAELDGIHRELGLQAPRRRYEIYNKQTGNSVEDAPARVGNDEDALTFLNDYVLHGPHALQSGQARDMFGIRTAGGVGIVDIDMPIAQGRAATSPTGQWKIIDGLGREVYRFRPAVNTRAKANELAAVWAREYNWDGNYQVEPAEEEATDASLDRPFVWKVIGSSSSPYQTQGVEVIASSEREAMQKARQQWNLNLGGRTEEEFFSTNGWSATPVRPAEEAQPGSTTDLAQQRATPGTFTGAWQILDNDGNEMHRFSGIGNNQRDANRVATQWVQNNGYAYGTEIEVVPIMS